jgi:hypothetical protein
VLGCAANGGSVLTCASQCGVVGGGSAAEQALVSCALQSCSAACQ